jgi:hypothetical protein
MKIAFGYMGHALNEGEMIAKTKNEVCFQIISIFKMID